MAGKNVGYCSTCKRSVHKRTKATGDVDAFLNHLVTRSHLANVKKAIRAHNRKRR